MNDIYETDDIVVSKGPDGDPDFVWKRIPDEDVDVLIDLYKNNGPMAMRGVFIVYDDGSESSCEDGEYSVEELRSLKGRGVIFAREVGFVKEIFLKIKNFI